MTTPSSTPRRGPRRLLAACAIAPLLAAPAPPLSAAPKPRPFVLEDMLRFVDIPDLRVSPDGRLAVFTVESAKLDAGRYETDLWIVPLDGSAPARQMTFRAGSETSPRWSPDGTRVAFLAKEGDHTQVWSLPVAGGEARRLTSHPESIAALDWAPDGKRLLALAPAAETEEEQKRKKERDDGYLLGRNWRNRRLWTLDAESGAMAPLTDGAFHVRAARWAPDGSRIALVTQATSEADSETDAVARVLEVAGGRLSEIPSSLHAATVDWSADGRWLLYVAPFDGKGISRQDLFAWKPGEAEPRNLTAPLDRDVEAARPRRDGRTVDVLYSRGARSEVVRVELDGGRIDAAWNPGQPLDALEPAGEGWACVRADRPAEVWMAGGGAGPLRPVTALNGEADGIQLPAIEIVAWDGRNPDVEGIVYKPYGHDPRRRYPMIVQPHGGPRWHMRAEFDRQAAYFASRGFVVLRPNFRGSTGYGDAFARGNVENWGDGPYGDIMAGVDVLVAFGVADPDRLFIYGWSYGGYMTNWAIGQTHRFRAAASGAGVADLRMQYTISDARRWRFDYFRGSPFAGHEELYARESPVTYARLARTPTLFVHGERDARCPLPQGLMMHRALRDNAVETELVVYPREDHEFAEPRHVLDRAKRIADWFERHDLKQRPAR